MKNKFTGLLIAGIALIVVIALTVVFLIPKDQSKDNKKPDNTTSTTSKVDVVVEDIVVTESSKNNSANNNSFIEPNESEADKLLEESKPVGGKPTNKPENESVSENEEVKSFEESKNELTNTALDYLKKHNIDPKTAGETGDICIHCCKKIWNPDKYGLFIPGMPENYENSGYCLGTCAITFG